VSSAFDRTGRRAAYDRLQAAARLARTWGDGYGYLMVATGRAEVMVDPIMALWDAAPMPAILEEAGGTFTDWQGNRTYQAGEGIATNGLLLDAERLFPQGLKPGCLTDLNVRTKVRTLHGAVIDHVNGLSDLDSCIVRAIGQPAARFEEDHLRMLRAVRFAARFGFELEAETRRAIRLNGTGRSMWLRRCRWRRGCRSRGTGRR